MMTEVPFHADGALVRLENYDLIEMKVDVLDGAVLIRLTFPPPSPELLVTLSGIASASIFKNPDDNDEFPFVGGIYGFDFVGQERAVLDKVGYPFRSPSGETLKPKAAKYYFRIEGDVGADIVCEAYTVVEGM